jgi:hypothetical protein
MTAINEVATAAVRRPFRRQSSSLAHVNERLGPLADLLGTWVGSKGFNIVAVPFPPQGRAPFTLLVEPYLETITFSPIGSKVPNRRAGGIDFVDGIMYELRNIDTVTNEPLHAENGMLLLLDQAKKMNSVARLASIPHGDCILALGDWGKVDGPPLFPPIRTLPSHHDTAHLRQYASAKTAQLDPQMPEATLAGAIAGQDIVHTTFINLSTAGGGGVLNIPFIDKKAKVTQFDCSFWIETIKDKSNPRHGFQQLQYSQTTIIEFPDGRGALRGRFPHVNINTLVKQ